MSGKKHPLKVAVIGAGPSGLVVLKMMLSEGGMRTGEVMAFEETGGIGGVWHRTPRMCTPYFTREGGKAVEMASSQPVYPGLVTNLPKDTMSFSDFHFPASTAFFPPHTEVLSYLERYAAEHSLYKHIRFSSPVVSCEKVGLLWAVTTPRATFHAERVVVCTGHFRNPFIPPVHGLETFTGRVQHTAAFTAPEDYAGECVLVVGGSMSGAEVVSTLSKSRACRMVCVSVRKMNARYRGYLKGSLKRGVTLYDGVEHIEGDTVHFSGGGSVKATVIIFGTGYRYSFPFLKGLPVVQPSGWKMENLYHRLLYVDDPTLAFVGMCSLVFTPFVVSEYQAHFLAKLYGGRISLPSEKAMRAEVESRRDDPTQDVLLFKSPSYCNSLARMSGFRGYYLQVLIRLALHTRSLVAHRHPVFLALALLFVLVGFRRHLLSLPSRLLRG
eukprot:Sspe_Gene.104216::Locus_80178_Transcript_1_1_Confidence_1.000_Length_1481::g.104216::m.104216